MNYKLTLNSSTYFSKLNATNNTNITYAIDWCFLPKDKSFLVSFHFISVRYNFASTNANNRQFLVNANLGQSNSYTGNATLDKMQNNILGGLKLYKASSRIADGSPTDTAFKSKIKNNSPIYIDRRPTDNYLTISITSIVEPDTTLLNSFTGAYQMELFFQEI
jgi:hypothetical protein